MSGGTADSDDFHYQFIETAIKNISDLKAEGVPAENITWMVVETGYKPEDLVNIAATADKLGINYVGISDKEQMIDYINNKDSETVRAEDQITYMSFFSHGQSQRYSSMDENQLSFAHGIRGLTEEKVAEINFTQSDIEKLNSESFNNTLTLFFSCNAGTKDSDGMSFAQEWTNKTGGKSCGIVNGRTLYSVINIAAPWVIHIGSIDIALQLLYAPLNPRFYLEKLKRRNDRAQRGYTEYGSLNYPCLVSLAGDLDVANPFDDFGLFDRGWKWFYPQKRNEEK